MLFSNSSFLWENKSKSFITYLCSYPQRQSHITDNNQCQDRLKCQSYESVHAEDQAIAVLTYIFCNLSTVDKI
jgi:hypothetical protein